MIKIDGKNSLVDLFFNTNNPFENNELYNLLKTETNIELTKSSLEIKIYNDYIVDQLEFSTSNEAYVLVFVENNFEDKFFNCPKELLDIINKPLILDYFKQKRTILQDFFSSQKNSIDLDRVCLKCNFYYKYFKNNKTIEIMSNNFSESDKRQDHLLFFIDSDKDWRIDFCNLSEKELKYVLNNFKSTSNNIFFGITSKEFCKKESFENTTLSEAKNYILKMVDENSSLKISI